MDIKLHRCQKIILNDDLVYTIPFTHSVSLLSHLRSPYKFLCTKDSGIAQRTVGLVQKIFAEYKKLNGDYSVFTRLKGINNCYITSLIQ